LTVAYMHVGMVLASKRQTNGSSSVSTASQMITLHTCLPQLQHRRPHTFYPINGPSTVSNDDWTHTPHWRTGESRRFADELLTATLDSSANAGHCHCL